eukprot:CAMPEP_0185039316 /NCGR_PEP_ID=MMETSP1103-20130426/36053_1 /TAXON_ID=36769 /ORGANISM="Paraphysomonas bandaiensis, Strain Caron Lab Isolate" /LENGTH=532 /DNA_ID=CAMNT_0027578157 /DNA_START=126 /DNA_END=1724 /DNA_ORIENTATION=+
MSDKTISLDIDHGGTGHAPDHYEGWVMWWTCVDRFKYFVSTVGIVLSCIIVFTGIGADYNVADFGGPVLEFITFFLALLLLAMNEAFQVGVLNTQHLDAQYIRDEGYPRAAKVHELMFGTKAAPVESNVKRLLIGQSFMVVLCSFTLAQLTTFKYYPLFVPMPEALFSGLVRSGLPGVVLVICFAQLTPSLMAKEYPLRILNIPGIYSTIYLALLIEQCGLVHFVYVFYGIVNRVCFAGTSRNPTPLSGKELSDTESVSHKSTEEVCEYSEEEDTEDSACEVAIEGAVQTARMIDTILLYVRYVLSTGLTVLCIVFVLGCIGSGHSMLEINVGVQFFLGFLALVIVTYCEGLKVAVVSTTHLDSEDMKAYPTAYKIHRLLNSSVSEGVKKFLLGRQLTVVPLGFLIAALTHFENLNRDNFPGGLYFIVVTAGLPGVLILLQIAQLTPQLLAQQNSILFLNLPGSYLLVLWTLAVESLGIVNFTWVLYFAIDKLLCRKRKDGSVYSRPTSNPLFCIFEDEDDMNDKSSTGSQN